MDFRRRFEFGLAWRTLVLIAAVWLFTKALRRPDLRAGTRRRGADRVRRAGAACGQFIRRTNFQVSRFIESVRFEDYSQRFSDPSGGGFDVLGDTLDAALKTLQARHIRERPPRRATCRRSSTMRRARCWRSTRTARVELLNKAARQLFARHQLDPDRGLDGLGPELAAAAMLPPGTRKITRLMLDGVPHNAIFASAQVARLDGPVTVLSILPVQSELGALEVAAQADLVRVLTHEIMNSLTPVTSLARSAPKWLRPPKTSRTACRCQAGHRDRRPPRRGDSPLRRKLSRVRPDAGRAAAARSRRSAGPRKSCGLRAPTPAIARSTCASRSSRRR